MFFTNKHMPHDQTNPLNIIGVIKLTGLEFENYLIYAPLCRPLIANVIVHRIVS